MIRILGLTIYEIYNSISSLRNEKNKLEKTKNIEKKKKRYSLEEITEVDEKFRPEDLEDNLLRSVIIDILKEFEFDDTNLKRKTFQLTEEK